MVTTYSHYAGAETQAAVELYADIITDHRRTGVARSLSQAPKPAVTPMGAQPAKRAAPRTKGVDLFLEPLSLMGKAGKAKR